MGVSLHKSPLGSLGRVQTPGAHPSRGWKIWGETQESSDDSSQKVASGPYFRNCSMAP